MRSFSPPSLRPVTIAVLLFLLAAGVIPQRSLLAEEPFAGDDYAWTDSTISITVDVLANDYGISAPLDPTSVTIVVPTETGTVTVDPMTGEIEFTPEPGSSTVEYLLYKVCDQDGWVSNPAYLWIDVVHDPPVAYNDYEMTPYNESITIDVLGNDFAGTSPIDPGSVTVVTPPSNGTTSVDIDSGQITYAPDNLFSGVDSFEYVVADEYGVTSDVTRVDVDVMNFTPEITWFDAWPIGYGNWVFEGQMQDERPETCTIELSGIISDSTTPDATGYFSTEIYLAPGTSGPVYATARDELGVQSAPASTSVYGG